MSYRIPHFLAGLHRDYNREVLSMTLLVSGKNTTKIRIGTNRDSSLLQRQNIGQNPLTSVTRFGEISPFGQIFQKFGLAYLVIVQKCDRSLAKKFVLLGKF